MRNITRVDVQRRHIIAQRSCLMTGKLVRSVHLTWGGGVGADIKALTLMWLKRAVG